MSKEETEARPVVALLLHLLQAHLPALGVALVLMLVQSVATLAQPWLGGQLANRLMLDQGFAGLLWLLFGLICAQAGLGYLVSLQLQKVSGRLVADASTQTYTHLQDLPLAWHQDHRRGDVLSLLTGDVHRLSHFITDTAVPFIPLVLTFFGALAMMLQLAPLLAVSVAVLMPLVFIGLKLAGRRLRPLGHAVNQAWAEQSALAEHNLELLPLIKSFATAPLEADRYRASAQSLYDIELRQARLQGAIAPIVHMVGAGLILVLLGLAGQQIVNDEMGMGQLVSLVLYGLVLVTPVSQLARVYGNTHSAQGAMQRLNEVLSAAPEVDQGVLRTLPAHANIQFHTIDFAYPGRPTLFSAFDLEIRAGETLALTGVNGAGKSTLVNLLLRLVEPQAGSVTIGGHDVKEFALDSLRGQIGLVSQHVVLLHATVAENIAYGGVNASASAIEGAARAARAHDFIAALPDGYETVIGDQGVRLSGGQRQRLALARALLKDPPILILDEATAMFDPAGEREFIAECHDVLKHRTVILITHRPASLALADRILQLDAGHVVETATH